MSQAVRGLPVPTQVSNIPGFVVEPQCVDMGIYVERFVDLPIAAHQPGVPVPRYRVEIRDLHGQLCAFDYKNCGVYGQDNEVRFAADLECLKTGSYRMLWRKENEPMARWDHQLLDVRYRQLHQRRFVMPALKCQVAGFDELPVADNPHVKPADGCNCKTSHELCVSPIPGPSGKNGKTPEFRVVDGVLQQKYIGDDGPWIDLFDFGHASTAVGWDSITGKPADLATANVDSDGMFLEFKRASDGSLIGKSLYS